MSRLDDPMDDATRSDTTLSSDGTLDDKTIPILRPGQVFPLVAYLLSAVLVLLVTPPGTWAQDLSAELPAAFASPDGKVRLRVALQADGTPTLAIRYGERAVLEPSPLGLVFAEGGLLGKNLKVTSLERSSGDQTYPIVAGAASRARAHYNQLTIGFREQAPPGREEPERRLRLVFRTYDEGAAFRYVIPEQEAFAGGFQLTGERTRLVWPSRRDTAWALLLPSFDSAYGTTTYTPMPVGEVAPTDTIGLPLVIKREEGIEDEGGLAVALAEADLTGYAGLYLSGAPGRPEGGRSSKAFTARLSPRPDTAGVAVIASAPHASPWRVAMIEETPAELIESQLLLHLNDPPAFSDTSWIAPGKASWHWWSGGVVGEPPEAPYPERPLSYYIKNWYIDELSMEQIKRYIDFAGDFGFKYAVIDAGWYGDPLAERADLTTAIAALDMAELAQYGRERGVGLILWANWRHVDRQMEAAFAQFERWEIRGVKIDFMNRDDQLMVDFYHEALKAAAAHRLVVDFHGAYKPTGIRRTYPNLLTREAVLGLEFSKIDRRITPEHAVTLPFTRMAAGPMDFTPGGFDNVTRENFEPRFYNPMVMGTRAHQLAMYMVYLSPLQMVSDHPSAYRGEEGSEFVRAVPASWDETVGLAGEIGEYVAVARRSGQEWYVGAMTGAAGRRLEVELDFLEAGRSYAARIWRDGGRDGGQASDRDAKEVEVETVEGLTAGDVLRAEMAPGGGYVARLRPEK